MKTFRDYLFESGGMAILESKKIKRVLLLNFFKEISYKEDVKRYYKLPFLPNYEHEVIKYLLNQDNIEVYSYRMEDLVVVENGMKFGEIPIKKFDYVAISRHEMKEERDFILPSLFDELKNNNIPYFTFATEAFYSNKIYTFYTITRSALKNDHVPTFVVHNENVEYFDTVIKEFGFPLVIKRPDSFQGRYVWKADNKKELKEILSNNLKNCHCIVQPFIENTGDFRVIVFDNKVIAGFKRVRNESEEFRNNTSLGGDSVEWTIPDRVKEVSVKVTKLLKYDICGLDFIYDSKKRKYLVMETNTFPAYGTFNSTEKISLLKYFVKKIKEEIG